METPSTWKRLVRYSERVGAAVNTALIIAGVVIFAGLMMVMIGTDDRRGSARDPE